MPTANNEPPWRAARNKAKPHEWLVERTVFDADGKPMREVARHTRENGEAQPHTFCSEDDAWAMCDQLNPRPGETHTRPLTMTELHWLRRVGQAPEGTMQPETTTALLSLEARGLVYSRAEHDRPGFDRWTLTDAGKQHLADRETKRKD
jgi:hypothetical protein